jgi:uncharacterized protein (DUF433 family)
MTITLHADPAPLRVDETGTIRVGPSRVTLDVLLQYWRQGMTPEEIARGLDTLTLADVHGALAYYFRHQAEMDEYLRQREQEPPTAPAKERQVELRGLIGVWKTDRPPSDEEVERILEQERLKKYG